jgi:hypothetical protein
MHALPKAAKAAALIALSCLSCSILEPLPRPPQSAGSGDYQEDRYLELCGEREEDATIAPASQADMPPGVTSPQGIHFPRELRARNIEGFSVLVAVIDSQGFVRQIHHQEYNHAQFALSAEESMWLWQFKPCAEPRESPWCAVEVTFCFSLERTDISMVPRVCTSSRRLADGSWVQPGE